MPVMGRNRREAGRPALDFDLVIEAGSERGRASRRPKQDERRAFSRRFSWAVYRKLSGSTRAHILQHSRGWPVPAGKHRALFGERMGMNARQWRVRCGNAVLENTDVKLAFHAYTVPCERNKAMSCAETRCPDSAGGREHMHCRGVGGQRVVNRMKSAETTATTAPVPPKNARPLSMLMGSGTLKVSGVH